MTRVCTICRHPKLVEIDKTLVGPTRPSYRTIAQQFSLSPDALYRHACEHLPEKMLKAKSVKEQIEADDLLGQARSLQEQAFGVLAEAGRTETNAEGKQIKGRDYQLMLRAIRESREGVRLLGEVLGRLQPQGSGNAPPTILIVRMFDNGRGIAPPRGATVERAEPEPASAPKSNGNGRARRR